MGQSASFLVSLCLPFSKDDLIIQVFGLEAAGNRTILNKIQLGSVVEKTLVIMFQVDTVAYKNAAVKACDKENATGLIFVVDSSDRDRLDNSSLHGLSCARNELQRMLAEDDLRGLPLLVFANKQDLPGALSAAEITECLGLRALRRPWLVQACSATTGKGLYEGIDWLSVAPMLRRVPRTP